MEAASCTQPVRNSIWPQMCANCTHPIVDHDHTVLGRRDPSDDAVWSWYLTHGGPWDPFGGHTLEQRRRDAVIAHLDQCAIDLDASAMPNAGTVEQFEDTDTGTTTLEAHIGSISCECDGITEQQWVVLDAVGVAAAVAELTQPTA